MCATYELWRAALGREPEFYDLKGMTIFEIDGLEEGSDKVTLHLLPDVRVRLEHEQDCCESVYVSDVVGDVEHLLNTPLLMAEEVVNERDDYKDQTWTFYKLATIKGYVNIRWCGSSNGYYSERVNVVYSSGA